MKSKNEENLDESDYDYDNMEIIYSIELSKTSNEELVLHWGLNLDNKDEWIAVDPNLYSSNTSSKILNTFAMQNSFSSENNLKIEIKCNRKENITGISFVLNDPIEVNSKRFFFFLYFF